MKPGRRLGARRSVVERYAVAIAMIASSLIGAAVASCYGGGSVVANRAFALESPDSTTPGCGAPIEAWRTPAEISGGVSDWSVVWNRVMAGGDGIPPIRTDDPERGCEVRFGQGTYTFLNKMVVSRGMLIRGQGPLNTALRFQNTDGVHVCYRGACPGPNSEGHGSWSEISDLTIRYSGSASAKNGVLVEAGGTTMQSVHVENFTGIGIRVDADTERTPPAASNLNYFERVRSTGNLGHGWHFKGGDANESVLVNVDATSNQGIGFFDESFLGNSIVGGHSAGNTGGCATATGDSQRGRWMLYCEQDQGIAFMDAPNILINPRAEISGNGSSCLRTRRRA